MLFGGIWFENGIANIAQGPNLIFDLSMFLPPSLNSLTLRYSMVKDHTKLNMQRFETLERFAAEQPTHLPVLQKLALVEEKLPREKSGLSLEVSEELERKTVSIRKNLLLNGEVAGEVRLVSIDAYSLRLRSSMIRALGSLEYADSES